MLSRSLLLSAALALLALPAISTETRDPHQHFFNLNTGDFKVEAQDAKQTGKKAILVMFEQEGCPGCLYMKRNVLNRADVQALNRLLGSQSQLVAMSAVAIPA